MANKLTNVVVSDGAITSGSHEDTGMLDTALDVVLAPVKAFSSENGTYVSQGTNGVTALFWGVGGGLLGEAWGHKREREGSKSFIPLFRG